MSIMNGGMNDMTQTSLWWDVVQVVAGVAVAGSVQRLYEGMGPDVPDWTFGVAVGSVALIYGREMVATGGMLMALIQVGDQLLEDQPNNQPANTQNNANNANGGN